MNSYWHLRMANKKYSSWSSDGGGVFDHIVVKYFNRLVHEKLVDGNIEVFLKPCDNFYRHQRIAAQLKKIVFNPNFFIEEFFPYRHHALLVGARWWEISNRIDL